MNDSLPISFPKEDQPRSQALTRLQEDVNLSIPKLKTTDNLVL